MTQTRLNIQIHAFDIGDHWRHALEVVFTPYRGHNKRAINLLLSR